MAVVVTRVIAVAFRHTGTRSREPTTYTALDGGAWHHIVVFCMDDVTTTLDRKTALCSGMMNVVLTLTLATTHGMGAHDD